jgi:hypothetical protein
MCGADWLQTRHGAKFHYSNMLSLSVVCYLSTLLKLEKVIWNKLTDGKVKAGQLGGSAEAVMK